MKHLSSTGLLLCMCYPSLSLDLLLLLPHMTKIALQAATVPLFHQNSANKITTLSAVHASHFKMPNYPREPSLSLFACHILLEPVSHTLALTQLVSNIDLRLLHHCNRKFQRRHNVFAWD
jgi:hypothetical protein